MFNRGVRKASGKVYLLINLLEREELSVKGGVELNSRAGWWGVAWSPSRYRRQEAQCLNNSVHFSLKGHKNNVYPRRESVLETSSALIPFRVCR